MMYFVSFQIKPTTEIWLMEKQTTRYKQLQIDFIQTFGYKS